MPLLDDIMDHPVLGREFKRGLAKGRHDGEITLLLRQIEKRFGPAPALFRERLDNLSDSEIEAAGLRLLDAQTLEDLLP
jgi:hypothetical protein